MSRRLLIPFAILGILGASSAVFAAQKQSSDIDHQHARHMKHVAPQHQSQASQNQSQPWVLPQGWPHT